MKVVEFVERDLSDALLLIGFPAQDVVGGIAANYLVKALRLELVGAVHDDDFPPSVAVQEDLGTSLVPVYAGDLACGPAGDCKRLIVIKCDLVLDPEFFAPLAHSILDWAQKRGIRYVASVEGVKLPDRNTGPSLDNGVVHINGLASLHGRDLLKELELPWLRHHTFTGFGAALLMKANAAGLPAVCVFTSTPHDRADARAAAKLLRALAPLLPGTAPLEPGRVERRTEELEAQIRLSNEEHLLALQRMGEGHSVMYV
jgi:predicted ATP-grasp superfamily ATP-dependent carboligase